DRAVLGAARGVAAFGLHGPEVGLAQGSLGAEAVAVGDLVEAVLHRLRADLDRLEEDVVLGIARHSRLLLGRQAVLDSVEPRPCLQPIRERAAAVSASDYTISDEARARRAPSGRRSASGRSGSRSAGGGSRHERMVRMLEEDVWSKLPPEVRGVPVTKGRARGDPRLRAGRRFDPRHVDAGCDRARRARLPRAVGEVAEAKSVLVGAPTLVEAESFSPGGWGGAAPNFSATRSRRSTPPSSNSARTTGARRSPRGSGSAKAARQR